MNGGCSDRLRAAVRHTADKPAAACRAVARHTAVRRLVGRSGDRGSATVWSLAGIAVLCVVFGVVLAMGQAMVARHRAAGSADLAALAAADHWADGGTAACARAGRVARAQSARLVRCVLVGEISDVTAASGQGPFEAEVRARAGPAEQDQGQDQGQAQEHAQDQASEPVPVPVAPPADASRPPPPSAPPAPPATAR
ncbi:secretion/DNA translocation related TadE-like protein [Streptomyces sp. LBL]|nr:secretion/DNA translocation related TadE-like protein [Streptomyces sp. LBL]